MNKKFASLLVPLLAITIILVLGIFWTIPTVKEYRSVNSEIDLAHRNLTNTLIPQRDTLASVSADDLQKNLVELNTAIPLETDPALILGVVEELAARYELSLSLQSFLQKDDINQILDFSFRVDGVASNLHKFLAEIENIRPVIFVELINATTSIDEDDNFYIETRVAIQSPFGKPGTENTPLSALTITDNDRAVIDELDNRFNYFETALYYKIRDQFPRGKTDPFIE